MSGHLLPTDQGFPDSILGSAMEFFSSGELFIENVDLKQEIHVIIQSKHSRLDFFLRIWKLKYIKQ